MECVEEDRHLLESLDGITTDLPRQEGEYVEEMDVKRLMLVGLQKVKELEALLEELRKDSSGTNQEKKVRSKLSSLSKVLSSVNSNSSDLARQKMEYSFANAEGLARQYALDDGYQSMPSAVRNAAACTLYHDIDMDNANPSIEIQMIERAG